jgi:hypothetical protein
MWYSEPNAIGYAKFRRRSHDAVIRVYDEPEDFHDGLKTRARGQEVVNLLQNTPRAHSPALVNYFIQT